MSLILNIETSTSVCSVALSEGEEVVFEKASFEGPSHAALLGVYMEEALEVAKSKGMKLDGIFLIFATYFSLQNHKPAYSVNKERIRIHYYCI